MSDKPLVLALADLKPARMMKALEQRYTVVRDPAEAAGARAVLTNGTKGLAAEQMERLPELGLVAVNGVGVDAVDLEAARVRGIAVTTTPDVLSGAVAELALALALAALRRVAQGDRLVRSGGWSEGGKLPLGRGFLSQRAGILGYGRIGRRLAEMLRGLGVEVLYTARAPHEGAPDAYRSSALELARDSDILFVTVAGGAGTRHLVDAEVLAALGPDGLLVNVARGSVVDESALCQALASGTLGFAALDVFDVEPHVPDPLLVAENVVLTPHIASATEEARAAMAQLVTDNIDAFFAGRPLPTPYDG